jgi:hypothetical protein
MLASHVPAALPHDVMQSLLDVFRPGEEILGSISSLAGSLVLTDLRVLIVREGRGYRPLSGIRSWEIEPGIGFTYGPTHGGLGRLMIGKGKAATSFFVKAGDWDAALRLVSMAHRIAHRDAATKGPALTA